MEVITHNYMHILINIFGRKAYIKKIKIKPNLNSLVLSVVRPAAILDKKYLNHIWGLKSLH